VNIIFCLPGKSYSGNFLKCWTQLIGRCRELGITVLVSQEYTSNVYYVRAKCLGANVLRGIHQIPFDGTVLYDYIMWIDSDVLYLPNHFESLLNRNVDIIGGLYKMENCDRFAAVKIWNEEYFKKHGTFEFLKKEDLISLNIFEVAYCGMGFMLIKHGVFETITYPWFAPQFYKFPNEIEDFSSEDVSFCKKAQKFGYKIYVDPKVIVGHEKPQILL
jgi:hypothetical protein